MKIFIENEAGYPKKNIFNEKTFEYIETLDVARAYPYPYGFILNTTAADGDNIDAFILTDQILKKGQIVDCEPIGLMEQYEKSWNQSNIEEVDHNVLVVLKGEKNKSIDEAVKTKLTNFVTHVFDNIQKNKTRVGQFLDKPHAEEHIKKHEDG